MKKIMALTLSLVLMNTLAFASFDYNFVCKDESQATLLLLNVSSSGVESCSFPKEKEQIELVSQYGDYGSIVLSFDYKKTQNKAYQLYLDMGTTTQWRGNLINAKGEQLELSCVSKN